MKYPEKYESEINFETLSIRSKRSFSQNWLVNSNAQSRVTDSLGILLAKYPESKLVEIGPGKGHLTKHLLDITNNFTAIELDREAAQFLRGQSWFSSDKINLVEADALELLKTQSEYFKDSILYSSLPYSVGSRILVELGQNFPNTPFCVIIQREVAQKTQLNSGKLTFFGAYLNLFWNLKIAFNLSKGNFSPAPKVTSSVLIGTPKDFEFGVNPAKLRKLLHILMADSKKTLANNLRGLSWSQVEIRQFLLTNELDEKTRLTAHNYVAILKLLVSRTTLNESTTLN